MFQVTAEVYEVLSLALRYFFAIFAVFLGLRGLLLTLADRREEKERLRHLPGAGTVGELVVISGGRTLAADTWFPVPREGVLGSLRSCDLVVDCRGVAGHHLDFSWRDGVGLLLSPRGGRQVTVNDQPLDARTDPESLPLTHGAILRVGDATLRFLVFAALNPSGAQTFAPVAPPPSAPPGTVPVQAYIAEDATPVPPVSPALPDAVPPPIIIPAPSPEAIPPVSLPGNVVPDDALALPEQPPSVSFDPHRRSIAAAEVPLDSPYRRPGRHEAGRPDASGSPPGEPAGDQPTADPPAVPVNRRRSDRWKEDWSE